MTSNQINTFNQNKIYIDNVMGVFIGKFNDNVLHKHYALQISVASKNKFDIIDKNNNVNQFIACYINSNVQHQFQSSEISLIILINPLSCLGHQLYNKYKSEKIISLDFEANQFIDILSSYIQNEVAFESLILGIKKILLDFKCECELENHFEDDRIYKAIAYLEDNFDRVVSLEEISKVCFLSETRFLHLFKEKTNLNFRRYQLWNKLIKSLTYLKKQNITETAHQFGFTDSSHYSRTFKETFGLSPKLFSTLK